MSLQNFLGAQLFKALSRHSFSLVDSDLALLSGSECANSLAHFVVKMLVTSYILQCHESRLLTTVRD